MQQSGCKKMQELYYIIIFHTHTVLCSITSIEFVGVCIFLERYVHTHMCQSSKFVALYVSLCVSILYVSVKVYLTVRDKMVLEYHPD